MNKLDNKVKQLNVKKVYQRPNLIEQFYALKQCGISVGETNCLHLVNALKTIATDY